MKTVRLHTFETNSSSTHCLILCKASEYQLFKDGMLFVHRWSNSLVDVKAIYDDFIEDLDEDDDLKNTTLDEFAKTLDKECKHKSIKTDLEKAVDDYMDNGTYETYESFGRDYETFYETKKIGNTDAVAFGYYD